MNYITTTDLRTKSKEIIIKLGQNERINLVHRSKIIGEIIPIESKNKAIPEGKTLNLLKETIQKFRASLSIDAGSEDFSANYKNHLDTKYNANIS